MLKEAWTGESKDEVPVAEYVVEMRERLQEMTELAQETAKAAQAKQKTNYDHRTRVRSLGVGDKVLVLLPKQSNKLKLEWTGPYTILRRLKWTMRWRLQGGRRKRSTI